MKFVTFLSLLGGTISAISAITHLFNGHNEVASIWGTASIWAFTTFFTELNLSKKEKQIQKIKDAISSSKDEFEAISKIDEIL